MLFTIVPLHHSPPLSIILFHRLRTVVRQRCCLHSPALHQSLNMSSWYTLYHNGADPDFISVTSLSREWFHILLLEFRRHYVMKTGAGKRGRPPRVRDTHCVLAALLHSFCSPADQKTWCEMFGIAPSTWSRMIIKAEISLLAALKSLPQAKICWPPMRSKF